MSDYSTFTHLRTGMWPRRHALTAQARVATEVETCFARGQDCSGNAGLAVCAYTQSFTCHAS